MMKAQTSQEPDALPSRLRSYRFLARTQERTGIPARPGREGGKSASAGPSVFSNPRPAAAFLLL